MLRAQLLPCVGGLRDVLNGVRMSGRVRSPEVERTEIDRFVRGAIHAMERHADEAPSLHVLPPEVEFDRTVREFHSLEVCGAFTGTLAQTQTTPRAIGEPGHAAVRDRNLQSPARGELGEIRFNGSLLTGRVQWVEADSGNDREDKDALARNHSCLRST